MNELTFVVYTACCVLAMAAQLAFALREWRSLGQREPMVVDHTYVRVERYFGLAFRDKLERWLWLRSRAHGRDVVVIRKDREEIWVHRSLTMAPDAIVDTLVVADSLETGQGCRLLREVYTRHDCRIGARNVVQALAADGTAHIGPETHIVRWVDAAGPLVVERGCTVSGRATSAAQVVLHAGARVRSVHAPQILTTNGSRDGHRAPEVDAPTTWMVLNGADDGWAAVDASGKRRRISADCMAYDGDLILPTVVIQSSLVVHGNLIVGPHSVLERDVKVTGSLRIGKGSICRGNLVAGHDVHLASGVTFSGVIFAEGSIRLSSAVSGIRPDPGVAVYAAGTVVLEPDVTIQGKVSSGAAVVVDNTGSDLPRSPTPKHHTRSFV